MGGGAVDQSSITLVLHVPSICAYQDAPALVAAAEYLRAEVTDDDGNVVACGHAPTADVVHEPLMQQWTITVIQDAADALEERLEAVSVADLQEHSTAVEVLVEGRDDVKMVYYALAYDLAGVIEEVLTGVDATLSGAPTRLSYTVYRASGEVARTMPAYLVPLGDAEDLIETRREGTRWPDGWTAADLLRAWTALHGLTLRCTYDAYPATSVQVEALVDAMPAGSPGLVLTEDHITDEEDELTGEPPEMRPFALRLGGEELPYAAGRYDAPRWAHTASTTGCASERASVDLSGGVAALSVARYDEIEIDTSDANESVATGRIVHAGDEATYLVSLHGDEDQLVVYREQTSPAAVHPPRSCETWARAAAMGYRLSRSVLAVRVGVWYLTPAEIAALAVGQLVEDEAGELWMLRGYRADLGDQLAELELVRPVTAPDALAYMRLPGMSYVRVRLEQRADGDLTRIWIVATWGVDEVGACAEQAYYQVDMQVDALGGGAWGDWARVYEGSALKWERANDYSSGVDVRFRARALSQDGRVGAWTTSGIQTVSQTPSGPTGPLPGTGGGVIQEPSEL
jgi:hypothetical protein